MARVIASLRGRGPLKGKNPLGLKAWERLIVSLTTSRRSVPDNVKKARSQFTNLQDELFARLIAREKIKNGRMPDFS